MVINDFEDDYKSDECDEHTATELFYKAAFNEQGISVSCEEYIKSREILTESELGEPRVIHVETVTAAEIALCLDRPEPIPEPVAVITLEKPCEKRVRESFSSATTGRAGSDSEGIASKLETRKFGNKKQSTKAPRKSHVKLSQASNSSSRDKRCSDSGDSDDINANIEPKRMKVKNFPSFKAKSGQQLTTVAKPIRKSTSPRSPGTVEDNAHHLDVESTELPTLSPELSSDDEITLSDPEGMELNVVSFGRGIPDKVTMKKKISPEEHKRLWHVDIDDKFRHLRRNRYHTAKECRNCRQTGHLSHQCSLPERIVCIFCAETTHLAARCPSKVCSTCKSEGHTAWRCFRLEQLIETKCRVCKVFGHRADICPDNWRRYHCTTEEGPPIAPEEGESLPRERKFCSWCGRQGHFAFECRRAGNSGIATRFVHSYQEPGASLSRSARRRKEQIATEEPGRTSRAEQGRAAVFGSDFVPIAAAASKEFRAKSQNSNSNGDSKKDKRTRRSMWFSERAKERDEHGRKRKFEPDYGGIEMLPSVKKRKRKNEAGSSDEKPSNRRKERRKLKRMQQRNERDKVKKKNSKRKGTV